MLRAIIIRGQGKDSFISPKEASNLLDGISFLILEFMRLTSFTAERSLNGVSLHFSCSVITGEGCAFTRSHTWCKYFFAHVLSGDFEGFLICCTTGAWPTIVPKACRDWLVPYAVVFGGPEAGFPDMKASFAKSWSFQFCCAFNRNVQCQRFRPAAR